MEGIADPRGKAVSGTETVKASPSVYRYPRLLQGDRQAVPAPYGSQAELVALLRDAPIYQDIFTAVLRKPV